MKKHHFQLINLKNYTPSNKNLLGVILLYFTIFYSNVLYSQKNILVKYKCFYNQTFATEEVKKESVELYNEYLEQEKIAEYLKFNLLINDTISEFKGEDVLISEAYSKRNASITKAVFRTNEIFYSKKTNDSIYNIAKIGSSTRLIKYHTNNFEWKLTSESKKIGEYLCFKAETEHVFYWNGKFRRFPVIAWYCPELPYSFGPLRYSNKLPGLILELSQFKMSYLAEEIILDTTLKVKIVIPEDIIEYKEIRTQEELDKFEKENE